MPTETQLRVTANARQAQQEITKLEREVQSLRQELGQTQRTADATGNEVQQFGQQSSRAAREARGLSDNLSGASRGTTTFTRSLGGLSTVLGGLGIAATGTAIFQLGAGSVRAAVQLESATNALTALHDSATVANATIERLRVLAQSPGISFPQAVDAAVRLKTVNIEGELAFDTIAELGNSLALVGSTDLSGILLGLTQIVSAGKVTTEEIRQITERSGIAAQAIQNAFGSLIGEDIQAQLESRGQDVRDFVQILVDELAGGARASADSTANAFSNLGNATVELQQAIGERFTPIVKAATLGLTGLIESITEGIRGTQNFTEVLAELNAELTRASGTIQLREAIDGGVDALEAFIRQSEEAIRNNSAFFGAREDAILTSQINQAREALEGYVGIQEQSIETEAELRAELARQETELRRIQGLQTDRNNLILEQGASARQASRIYLDGLREREDATNASIDDLERQLQAFDAVGMAAEEATDTATEGTDEVTESTKETVAEVQRLTEIYEGLNQSIKDYVALSVILERGNQADFYRLARGEVDSYDASIKTAIVSIVDAEAEQEALNTVFNEQSVAINMNRVALDAETQALLRYLAQNDALDESLANVERRLDAHNAALINPAVSEAAQSVRAYIDTFDDLDVSFQRIETVSDMLTRSVRDQASAFDELRASMRATADAAPSGIFDQFDPSAPGVASGISQSNAGDLENVLSGAQGVGFEFLREGAFQTTAEDIDTVGESVTAFGDIIARVASGDLTALGDAVGRTFGIIEAQNEAFEQRRQQRRAEAVEDRTARGTRFGNLERVGSTLGLDFDDPALAGLRQNIAAGLFDLSSGFLANIQRGVDASDLDGNIARGLLHLTTSLDRAITGADVQMLFDPFIASFEGAMTSAGTQFEDALQGTDTDRIGTTFQTYVTTINDTFDAQIGVLLTIQEITGVIQFEAIQTLSETRQNILNQARASQAAPASRVRLPGTRYNAALGGFEPTRGIFTEDASGGSGLGAPPQESADARVGIEEDTQARILAIQERAIEDRAANEQRLQDDIQSIADSVVAFHERTEQRKVQISERATEDRQRIEQRLQDDIQSIADSVVGFHERTQGQITSVQARAAMDRLGINERYNDDVQSIADSVVAFHEQTQARITAVTERAAADRLAVEERYNADVQQIADSVVAFHTRTQEQITNVTERAAADRLAVENRYSDDVQGIYDDVAERYGDAEAEKVAITERAAADRARAEETYADTVQGIINGLVDNVRSIQDQIVDAEMQAVQDRMDAQMDYNNEVQDIYNNLADEILSIEERLNNDLDRIGERRLASEQSRIESLERLRRGRGESVEDRELGFRRQLENLGIDSGNTRVVSQFLQQNQGRVGTEGFQGELRSILSSGPLSGLPNEVLRLFRDFTRDTEDINIDTARERIRIAERAEQEQVALTTQEGAAIMGAATQTTEAEAAAGTTAAEALMNAVPPLDAMSTASMNLATTLTTIDTNLATDVGLFNEAITNLETDAGISFEDALSQYTPSLSAMAEAGQTFADAIGGINTQELTDLANVDTNFAEFIQAAGVTLPDALANASPPMTRLAAAIEARDTGLLGIDEGETADIMALMTGFDNFVNMAGIPLTEALTLASPPMTRLAIAMESLDTGIADINEGESDDIAALTTGLGNFVNMAGIPLTSALELASPPMTRLAAAIEARDTGLLGIDDRESADIMALTTGMADFVANAGIPLASALELASPPMTLLAQALGQRDEGIAGVDEGEVSALAAEDVNFASFVQAAGIDLPNALELATPTMSRHAAALEGFNSRAFGIDTQETSALTDLGVGSTPPSDRLEFAMAMASPPQTASPEMLAMVSQPSRQQPVPVEIMGDVSIDGIVPVDVQGTSEVSSQQIVSALNTVAAALRSGLTVSIGGQQIAQVVNENNVQLEAEGGLVPVG